MKVVNNNKFISLIVKCLMICMVLAVMVASLSFAKAAVIVVDEGESVSFTLSYSNACAVEGHINLSNSAIISNVTYSMAGSNMQGLVENGKIFLYTDSDEGVSGQVIITVTIHSAAEKGSSSVVDIIYSITEPGQVVPGKEQVLSNTITVRTDPVITPAPTATPTPKPTATPTSVPGVDVTKLKEQIKIAKSLTSYDYTKETWAQVEAAQVAAEEMLTSSSQSNIDTATNRLKTALSGLIPMDYTALQSALDSVHSISNMDELSSYWERFVLALIDARIQRTSGDQAAVDAATQELLDSKIALITAMEELGEVIEVEKEVPVEVPPSYAYCNDTRHTIYLIIMIVSLVLNLLLIVTIAFYLFKRFKKQKDDTPLVEYDIDDDFEPDTEQ